jgi:RHS repeat-associated protein
MGRVLSEKRTINGTSAITKTTQYTYYFDGELATLINPNGNGTTVTYTPNGAGRPVSASDAVNTYVSGVTYAPHGAFAGLTYGGAIYGAFTYNSRLQPLQMAYGTSQPNVSGNACPQTAASIMQRIYDFHGGNGDNGLVQVINNCKDTNRTQNFFYDSLNRITQAYTTGNSPLSTSWGETFTIDAWSNLTNKGAVTGKTNTENLNVAPTNVKNQVNGVCNDAAGNLVLNSSCPTGTFTPTYSYDIENRLTSAATGYTYVYDGDDKRVKKCTNSGCTTGKLYWTGVGSDPLVESGLGGSNTEQYIFFSGRRVARAEEPVSTTNVHYYFSDHLGSADVITNPNGTQIQKESDYYPYGGEIVVSGSDINNYKFSGKERDSESGLDNFGARYDSSSLGRFMTPDWAARPTAVPYAVFGDPQSLNLYGYVRNDPVSRADLDGHAAEADAIKNMADVSMFGYGFWGMGAVAPGDLLSQSNIQNKEIRAQQHALAEAQNQKPPTPAQIKKAFYKQHGKDFNAAVQKVFGKDASKVPTQTLANSPKLDTSKSRADLSQMKGMKEPVEGFNHPDMSQYPAGPIAAQNGTIYVSSDIVKSGAMPEIFGTYAHEMGNLLDMQINGRETTYGNPNDPVDKDTGQQVEKTEFPQ